MIKSFEELGEILAEFENRISLLENSMPNPQELDQPEKPPEPQWTQEQWRYVQQLRGMVLHLDKQVKEALSKKKKPEGKFS